MEKNNIAHFFDQLAPAWDDQMIKEDVIIQEILDCSKVGNGSMVLDVACGTGVLIPDYLQRNVKSVIGVDISQKMIAIAQKKFQDERVRFICADIYALCFEAQFDCILVYNAFPHFFDPEKCIRHLSMMLRAGGRLTIAHGASRDRINQHHTGSAKPFSIPLMEAHALQKYMTPHLSVKHTISNERMYLVTGEHK